MVPRDVIETKRDKCGGFKSASGVKAKRRRLGAHNMRRERSRTFAPSAFRHGLGTALSESGASPKTVQAISRHTDIQTTFRYCVHGDVDAQRNALAAIGTMCQLVQKN